MHIMPSRYDCLVRALSGYEKTGTPFLGFDGAAFAHPHFGDDEGIYYFIPKIAHTFHVSLNMAVDIFFLAILLGSLLAGITGILLLFRTRAGRIAGTAALCFLTGVAYYLGDVYIMSSSAVIGIIPLFIYFAERKYLCKAWVLFLFLAGVGLGIANFIRAHAGTAVLLFMAVYLLLMKKEGKAKLISLVFIIAGIMIPFFWVNMLLDKRDDFLLKQQPNQEAAIRRHVFWHSAYIGLGFLNNKYGITYLDEVAIDKVRSLAPDAGFLSQKYEQTLRNEALRIIKKDPLFIFMTLSAKAGVLLFYFMIFSNVGLLAAFLNAKEKPREAAFWSAIFFTSLPGLLIMPLPNYLLGFIALAVLYGIINIDVFVSTGGWSKIKTGLVGSR